MKSIGRHSKPRVPETGPYFCIRIHLNNTINIMVISTAAMQYREPRNNPLKCRIRLPSVTVDRESVLPYTVDMPNQTPARTH
jgi:hypothetical protein